MLGGVEAIGSKATEFKHGAAHIYNNTSAVIKTYRAFRDDVKGGADKGKKGKAADKGSSSSSSSGGGSGGSSDAKEDGAAGGAEAAAEAAQADLRIGARVMIRELKARPELNGYGGRIIGWNEEKERYVVELDGAGDNLLLKAANLLVVPADGAKAAGAAAGGGEGGDAEGGGGGGGGGMGGPSEDTVMLMLESMWRVSMLDIEGTLRRACNKVLSDQSVDKDARKARARGLVLMGRIFQSYGSADALKTTDFTAHMQQVGERMAQKVAEENDKQHAAKD